MPLTFSYTLLVTSPATITGPTSIPFNLTLLTAPAGVSASQALSFVSVSQGQSGGLVGGLLGGLVNTLTNTVGTLLGNNLNGIATLKTSRDPARRFRCK